MANPKKGQIVRRGGKEIISDGRGGGRVVTSRDRARSQAAVRIKRATESGEAPPIPQPVGKLPTTQKELNVARAKAKAKKKVAPRSDAIKNEPTTTGIRKAFEEAAEGRKKAEEALQRKK